MQLTREEQEMLDGAQGRATRKAMEILAALGEIFEAERMTRVTSVQIAGVSYDNLGEAGLKFLIEMAEGGGEAKVQTTLNPAGMDIHNWQELGIPEDFARNQKRVIQAFETIGVETTCTCTPYLAGNLPNYGEHIAWAESSAVCYANSIIGARTNREGGPSALAACLTGRTPMYGFHLEANRAPNLTVEVGTEIKGTHEFGALGKAIGDRSAHSGSKTVPYILGIKSAFLEELKSFCASLATYAGAALFHIPGITPEAERYNPPAERIQITRTDLEQSVQSMNDQLEAEADFVSLGCPHLTIDEIARIAQLLEGRQVVKEFWITTSRPVKRIADQLGYSAVIEESGAKFATDTCCVVAPIKGRFQSLVTDSAKACYYAYAKNEFKTRLLPFEEVVLEATRKAA